MSGDVGVELTQAVYYRLALSREPSSYTWSFDSPVSANGTILAYRGVNTRRPIDSHAGRYTPDAVTFPAPSVRTATNGDRLLAFFSSTGTNGITPPKGMAEDVQLVGSNLGLEAASSVIATAATTGARRAADSAGAANSSNFGQLVALRPACSGTTGKPRVGQRPAILGSPHVGLQVATYSGSWCGKRPMHIAYRWQRCVESRCSVIKGATSRTYTPTTRDFRTSLTVLITGRNTAGTTTVKSRGKRVGLARPTNTLLPTISGTAASGFTLSASTGSWTGVEPMTYAYQWQRCDGSASACVPITQATSSSYVASAADLGATLSVVVTATNSSGSASATSAATAVVVDIGAAAPMNDGLPTVSGNAKEGETLTGSSGDWSGTAPISHVYQWQRCDPDGSNCSAVSGATGQTYSLEAVDVGSALRLLVTAINTAGSSSATSTPTDVVATTATPPLNSEAPFLTGIADVGVFLNASTGTWSGTTPMTYSYQWRRCDNEGGNCASIVGETSSSYRLAFADAGSTLRVLVTASNAVGSNVATSRQTAVVTSPAPSVYWGAWIGEQLTGTQAPWDMNAVAKFEDLTGKPVSTLQFASPWQKRCSATWSYYNFDTVAMSNIVNHGAIPFFTWSSAAACTSDQSDFQLAKVAAGKWDSYITSWAQAARNWGRPFFLRFDAEQNGTWNSWSAGVNGNTAADFVNAWRHVHDVFVSVGATNATWVWCPNIDPYNVFTDIASLYPGDPYVDWTCLDGYNFGTNPAKPGGWRTFDQAYSSTYHRIVDTIAPSKPMIVGEVASSEYGGSKAAWITDMLSVQLPVNYPAVKGVLWFDKYDGSLDWPIETSASATQAFAQAIQSPYFASSDFGDLPLLTKVPIPSPAS
jgi:hypothetical protein